MLSSTRRACSGIALCFMSLARVPRRSLRTSSYRRLHLTATGHRTQTVLRATPPIVCYMLLARCSPLPFMRPTLPLTRHPPPAARLTLPVAYSWLLPSALSRRRAPPVATTPHHSCARGPLHTCQCVHCHPLMHSLSHGHTYAVGTPARPLLSQLHYPPLPARALPQHVVE